MNSLIVSRTDYSAGEIKDDGKDQAQANLVLAVKSTPSLNKAFNGRNNSVSRSAINKVFSTQPREREVCHTAPSDVDIDRTANLNVMSHGDLNEAQIPHE